MYRRTQGSEIQVIYSFFLEVELNNSETYYVPANIIICLSVRRSQDCRVVILLPRTSEYPGLDREVYARMCVD